MIKNQLLSLWAKVKIIRVVLDENFEIVPYLGWFDQLSQQKICSYYHYKDKLIAFTSNLLQKYYLPFITNCERSDFVINYSQYHKPYIVSPKNTADHFNFNIAHTYNQVIMALYAGNDYVIGVDIEKIDSLININEIASIVFSKSERLLINGNAQNFFKLWTKKESLIKALGTGFATDFYQDTQLNLDDVESNSNYHIFTYQIDNYFLSICLHKAI